MTGASRPCWASEEGHGQVSTASFTGQDAKMAAVGRAVAGKVEHRKELGRICLMHPGVFVAQTTAAHVNHFYRAITTTRARGSGSPSG